MRPLFLRVFLSFLFAMAAAAIAFALLLGAMRRDALQASWTKITSGALSAVAQSAAEDWSTSKPETTGAYLTGVEQIMDLDLTLFSSSGAPLSYKRPVDPAERELASDALRSPVGSVRLAPTRLSGAFVTEDPTTRQRYVLTARVRGSLVSHLVTPILRLLIALSVVGLVTYVLTRSITDPILRLREAAARFGSGDLAARVATTSTLARRNDEIGALGRDFDRMAERVEAAMLAQNRLLADISHELRSPLTRLSVALALARQRRDGDDALLDRIEREAGRMNELIEGLLTISRLDSPERPTAGSDAQIDLVRLVRDVSKDADYEAAASGRRCIAETPSSMPTIVGDIELLHRAVENVTRNAVRYTDDGTAVEVSLATSADRLLAILQVRDHGPGVATDALPDLFRPFYRVSVSRDRSTGGTGLGLAIADRAIRFHGGVISAENAEGGGLVVTITLPLSRLTKSDHLAS